MSQLQQQYLKAMGIPVWQRRQMPVEDVAEPVSIDDSSDVKFDETIGSTVPVAEMDWVALQQAVSECQLCRLQSRPAPSLFAMGNMRADVMVITEGYGEKEVIQGSLLAGDDGSLLAEMLAAIGIGCSQVYYTNLLKCCSAGKAPGDHEWHACIGYLQRQIALLRPKLLFVMGETVAQQLLQTSQSLTSLRQQTFEYGQQRLPLLVTYSMTQLFQTPLNKRDAWQDLCRLQAMLSQSS